MSLELKETQEGKVLEAHVSGKLSRENYERFVPETERLIQANGKIRILFAMHDFHGWDAGALWEDIKFDLKHFRDIERVAMVGEKNWQKWMSHFCKPFTTAKVRYFDTAEMDQARAWLNESL